MRRRFTYSRKGVVQDDLRKVVAGICEQLYGVINDADDKLQQYESQIKSEDDDGATEKTWADIQAALGKLETLARELKRV
jgi:hypothetical protein